MFVAEKNATTFGDLPDCLWSLIINLTLMMKPDKNNLRLIDN